MSWLALFLTEGHVTRPTSLEIGGRHSIQEGLHTAIEVQVFKKYCGGLLSGDPVKELQRADSSSPPSSGVRIDSGILWLNPGVGSSAGTAVANNAAPNSTRTIDLQMVRTDIFHIHHSSSF